MRQPEDCAFSDPKVESEKRCEKSTNGGKLFFWAEIRDAVMWVQGRPRIAKPRMMKENGAKKRTAHTGSFRQQTQRTRGDAKKTMLRNGLDYFKESMLS